MQQPSRPSGSIIEPARQSPATNAFGPAAPGTAPVAPVGPAVNPSAPLSSARNKKLSVDLIKTIAIIILSLLAVTFLGLFVWKYFEWDEAKTNVDGQIDASVAIAVSENTTKLENEFLEREKYPYKTFAGPADYGSLSFEYPKTWSLYVAADAVNGGDYNAYFNPGEVLPVNATNTLNALRVTIRDAAFDNEVSRYEGLVKSGKLSLETRSVGGTLANVYTGELNGNIQGILTAFKLRDKTVLIQTDAMLFQDEYYKLLDTVQFIE